MNDSDDNPTPNPKSVAETFAAAEAEAAHLQEIHLEAAQHAGYAKAVLHAIAPYYVKAAEFSEDMPNLTPVVTSGIDLAGSITAEFHSMAGSAESILAQAHNLSGTISLLASSTDSTAAIIFPGTMNLDEYEAPPFFAPDEDATYKKLCEVDPPLAQTYREVGQAFHGTTADPSRAAIACMRQTLDHFFGYLAPDDAVRNSSYWKPKAGEDMLLITRRERITYATHTYIKEPKRAKTLLNSIDVVLEAYQFLHHLHQRGALSEKQANKALRITKTFIETWVEAMDLPTTLPPA